MRDLPKILPPKAMAELKRTALEVADVADRKARAFNAYEQHRRHARGGRSPEGAAQAEAILDWSVRLRSDILVQFGDLRDIFMDLPALELVSHEIVLPQIDGGIPAGRLRTRLELDFDDERLLNHHDAFDGYRVTGGGTLNTAVAIETGVHPEMLRQIHALIAEGQVWDRVIHGFGALIEAYKDR